MHQSDRGFPETSFETLKRAVLLNGWPNGWLNGLIAPVIISTLLAFVAISGNASAQSTASGVPQQISSSDSKDSKTPGTAAVQSGGGGYLGVYLGDVNEDRARELSLKEIRGAVVGRVEDASPAAKAGLHENDVILAFNDQRVQNRAQFHRLLSESRPGGKATLEISRRGVARNVEVVLGQRHSVVKSERERLFGEADAFLAQAEERRQQAEELLKKGDEKGARELFEQEKAFRQESEKRRAFVESQLREGKIREIAMVRRPGYGINASRYRIGVSVSPLSEQLTGFFNAPRGGVLVAEVRAGEAGERAGLKAGDCIVSVNGESAKSPADLNRLVDQKGPSELEFVIVRDRHEQTVKVKLEQK